MMMKSRRSHIDWNHPGAAQVQVLWAVLLSAVLWALGAALMAGLSALCSIAVR